MTSIIGNCFNRKEPDQRIHHASVNKVCMAEAHMRRQSLVIVGTPRKNMVRNAQGQIRSQSGVLGTICLFERPHDQGTLRSGEQLGKATVHAGTQMLNAIQRIERRVQRERMVAVTGKDAVDSDEENAEPAADGDDLEGAVQEEDDNNDKDEEGEEDNEETYQSTKGPKDQYDLNDDFIDDSEVRCCTPMAN